MHITQLLHNSFAMELNFIDKRRLKNVFEAVSILLAGSKLTLTNLGQCSNRNIKMRHAIKWSDRLLGNKHLQKEREAFYQTMAKQLLQHNKQPYLHVDWSCLCATTNLYVLRASLSMSGRSIVIYEKCYPKSKENNHKIHKEFLHELAGILPDGTTPVIVTDAGFRAPWFEEIYRMNWNFVGRLRNRNLMRLESQETWELSKEYYKKAGEKPKKIGLGCLTKKKKLKGYFYLHKAQKKNRHKKNLNGKKSLASKSLQHSRAQREPWLLISSLDINAQSVVNIYSQRMRIEENFRDTKCTRYGFSLNESLTYGVERMNILLLISALATFACCLVGILIEHEEQAADYQAHSAKFKNVLSRICLGRHVIRKGIKLVIDRYDKAIQLIFQNIQAQQEAVLC